MVDMPSTLQDKQRDVQMKVGGFVLRVQQYELLLRQLLQSSDITLAGSRDAPTTLKRARQRSRSKLSLGHLIDEMQTSLLRTSDFKPDDTAADDVYSFRTRFALQVTPDRLATIKKTLKAMVRTRNKVVHRLLELHDLGNEGGCDQVIMFLVEARSGLEREYEELRRMHEARVAANQHLIEMMRSPEFEQLLLQDQAPLRVRRDS